MRNLLLSGGPYHDFAASSRLVAGLLDEEDLETDVTEDVEGGLAEASRYDVITFNMLRWRMQGEMFDGDRAAWAGTLSPAGRDAVLDHLARGRGVLALHTAAICFDDWPGWRDVVGACWDWRRSSHPPPRPSAVTVRTDAHPIVECVHDFEVVDEIYSFLDDVGVEPLMTAERAAQPQPLLWAREVGGGRVAYDALGHDERSLTQPSHATIIRRAAAWVTGRIG
jgi:type 1 glutamine amidotransferase